jgi:diaminohydroxyphosphoribosylaminopyrimidine deaminase/5-amino-6-(5-phosphoribosylamino)uracil reductase
MGTLSELDLHRLREAIELAHEAIGRSDPNPRVGCVLGRSDGSVLGRGATQRAGGPHAEVVALRDAAGRNLRGCTAWVSLEPCSHHGRTPPCCDALIEAGVGRVVVAVADPYAEVDGRGIARLRAAGIQVDLAEGEVAREARELNIGFFARHERGRPWVRVKVAMSLDGRTALPDGRSRWITGEAARTDGHAWRKRASAVLTGIGTVLADNPRLDVRLVQSELQPLRVVLDSALRTPPSSRVLEPPGRVLIAAARDADGRADGLRRRGAEVLLMPGAGGHVDLPALVEELARRAVNELHVEAGAAMNAALLRAGLVDEWLVYQAGILLGPGPGLADIPAPALLAAAPRWQFTDLKLVGPDLRLLLRPAGLSSRDTP